MLSSRKIRGRASVFAIDNPVQLHDFSWNKVINSNEQTQRISWQNFQNNLKCKLVIYLFAPNIFLREILFLNSFQAFRIFTFSPFASLLSMSGFTTSISMPNIATYSPHVQFHYKQTCSTRLQQRTLDKAQSLCTSYSPADHLFSDFSLHF